MNLFFEKIKNDFETNNSKKGSYLFKENQTDSHLAPQSRLETLQIGQLAGHHVFTICRFNNNHSI